MDRHNPLMTLVMFNQLNVDLFGHSVSFFTEIVLKTFNSEMNEGLSTRNQPLTSKFLMVYFHSYFRFIKISV